jgi:hypothetical protein
MTGLESNINYVMGPVRDPKTKNDYAAKTSSKLLDWLMVVRRTTIFWTNT